MKGQDLDLVDFFPHLDILEEAESKFEPAIYHEIESMVHLLELVASEDLGADDLGDGYEEF